MANAPCRPPSIRRPRLQPLLHPPVGVLGDRHLDSPFSLTEMRRALRAGPPRRADRDRAGARPRARCRLRQPHPPPLRIARAPDADAAGRRIGAIDVLRLTAKGRRAFTPLESRARAQRPIDARPPAGPTISAASSMRWRPCAACSAGDASSGARLRAATAPAGRHGLGGAPPRRDLRERMGLQRRVRGAGREIVADFLDHFDPARRTLLDCRAPRRHRRLGVPGAASRRPSRSCGCCWSSRARAASASAAGWSTNASGSPAAAGYGRITLWTQSDLDAARRIYKAAGFERVAQERHDSFGKKNLVAETWTRAL